MEKIINADDFGMSDEINRAIERAFERGCVTSASLATNGARAKDALKFARGNPSLRIGVHLTLTEGAPLSDPASLPLLVGTDGRLTHGFVRLLWLSLTRESALLEQAELEWRKQIVAALEYGIVISHLDSHRHVHMIPAVSPCAQAAARIRRAAPADRERGFLAFAGFRPQSRPFFRRRVRQIRGAENFLLLEPDQF